MEPELQWQGDRFRVLRRRWRDEQGREHTRDFIDHPGAVAILPWIDERRVCLIRNQRQAVGETLLEIPAGTLEPGEDPLETARRELAEETGYRADQWSLMQGFWMSPGILRERMHLYVARGLSLGATDLDAGEQIERVPLEWETALEMATTGQIHDAKTLVALLLYERMHRAGTG